MCTWLVDDPGSTNQEPIQPEAEEEHHDSIAAAIMSRRKHMHDLIDSGAMDEDHAAAMAEGGEATLEYNAEEQPNELPPMNGKALDWDDDSEALDAKQPEDSNEHGDVNEAGMEDEHDGDVVSAIRN
jgi:hypothetical protein